MANDFIKQLWDFLNEPTYKFERKPMPPGLAALERDQPESSMVTDFLSSLTSPIGLATGVLSGGAGMAGKAGLMGLSKAARMGEAALSAPFVATGAHQAVTGEDTGNKVAGA